MSPSTISVNLAIYGVGLVGSEFISQVLRIVQPHNRLIRIVSISSSKKTIFASSPDKSLGEDWRIKLDASHEFTTLDRLSDRLRPFHSARSKVIFVDNTSSPEVAAAYPMLLREGISVVTPNKKAFSGSLGLWEDILKAQREGNAVALNEATVGAGLPIIAPLKELVATGDEIVKIEGVFSGTLSYIFNEFSPVGGSHLPSFSSVVKVAKDNGYTEPNPADDLSGSDVARKLTILSRLIPSLSNHLSHGFEDVSTSSLVPTALRDFRGTGDEFIQSLDAFDSDFDHLRTEARERLMVLRYAGAIDVKNKTIKAALDSYSITHPFATSLRGSDNIILFYTKRYGNRPFIVQGAGAGASVTAMGVLGDVLKISV